MQSFFSSVTSKVLATAAALVADENDDELAPASVSQAEVEFAEGISIETFSAFPPDKLDDTWIMVPAQEAHAKAILESSTNLRDIRFKLCPSQLRDEDFWQIYFIVTQKDGVEAVEQQSLGSSWGTCPSYSMGIVSSDENEAVPGRDAEEEFTKGEFQVLVADHADL